MKNKKMTPVYKVILIFSFCFLGMALQPATAQISFPDDVDDETPAAPIDGFIGLGIAAGAYYGYRKLKVK